MMNLVYLGADKIDNLRAVLLLPWVQDAISSTEYDILDRLSGPDPDAVAAMIAMPFLSSPDATDALAVRAVATLSAVGPLDALVDSPLFKNGIDDGETALVAALGSFKDADALRRVLAPGAASVEALSASTALTPALKISIIRTGSQSRPGTAEAVRDAVEFAEDIMGLPLPVEHVIVVLDVDAIPEGAAGANYDGFAISYSPEYETRQGTYEWRILQSGFTHEVAHYYWIGHASWIDEGLANVFEYMRGRADGLSPGQLKTTRRGCEAHDLKMLETWDVSPGDSSYICSYYLGERLFLELLEALGRAEFATRLGELYQAVEEVGDAASVIQVRQVFAGQESIVDRHWSGALNAPENRPFDEGVERTSHDLIQWDQHPTYDGHSVRFSGTLLDGAVLSKETIEEARQGGYQNFFLRAADAHDFAGHILPPFTDGTSWTLDAGDSVATTYSLDAAARSFTITFPFPEGLGTPSDYVVVVDGFQDDSRTPRMGGGIDNLGYARIRVE